MDIRNVSIEKLQKMNRKQLRERRKKIASEIEKATTKRRLNFLDREITKIDVLRHRAFDKNR
jgi:hypothetical protein